MHAADYLAETAQICAQLDAKKIEAFAQALAPCTGKIFIIGMGGSLANAIHMAADLRKLCGLDAEAFDNIAELTARANDEGLDTIFVDWLKDSNAWDKLIVLSVGGGTKEVSGAICKAIDAFKGQVLGIVGPEGGYTAEKGSLVIRVPFLNPQHVTPHTEAFQAVIWHALVSHPMLQKNRTKW
jgi:D-sedoheptulose 7-phosphate isomerase